MDNKRDVKSSLSREEFSDALRKGLGRAAIHVARHGIDNVADLVLETCLHDQAFDPQCEDSRASWLFEMFNSTSHYATFRDSILAGLEKEEDTWNLTQLFELARDMALKGDGLAREVLRKRAIEVAQVWSEHDWAGAEELVAVEGTDGILTLARAYGQRLQRDPVDFVSDNIMWVNRNRKAEFIELLKKHSELDADIKRYVDYLKARGDLRVAGEKPAIDRETAKSEWRQEMRKKYTLESTLNDAQNKAGDYPGHYTRFGRTATAEELQSIYSALLDEKDDAIRTRLLWVFRVAALPDVDAVLFSWARENSEELRAAAISALSQVKDERIGELAREKIKAHTVTGADSEAVGLLQKNYRAGDAELIAEGLATVTPDAQDAHSIIFDIIALAEEYEDARLADSLLWAYENGPCTSCRYNVIRQLDRRGRLTMEMVEECSFDADRTIREYVDKKRGREKRVKNE